jgi:hypothetical protein
MFRISGWKFLTSVHSSKLVVLPFVITKILKFHINKKKKIIVLDIHDVTLKILKGFCNDFFMEEIKISPLQRKI